MIPKFFFVLNMYYNNKEYTVYNPNNPHEGSPIYHLEIQGFQPYCYYSFLNNDPPENYQFMQVKSYPLIKE